MPAAIESNERRRHADRQSISPISIRHSPARALYRPGLDHEQIHRRLRRVGGALQPRCPLPPPGMHPVSQRQLSIRFRSPELLLFFFFVLIKMTEHFSLNHIECLNWIAIVDRMSGSDKMIASRSLQTLSTAIAVIKLE